MGTASGRSVAQTHQNADLDGGGYGGGAEGRGEYGFTMDSCWPKTLSLPATGPPGTGPPGYPGPWFGIVHGDLPGGNSYTIVTQTFQAEQMGPFIVRVVSENAVEKGATISGGKWVATTFSF